MSRASVDRSVRELEGITTDLLWRQWSAVGGSATTAERWHSIVDPEALVLASLYFIQREPRIGDILYSWVELHAPLLSVQRLRNIQKGYPKEVAGRVADFVANARIAHKHPRWRALTSEEGDDDPSYMLPEVRRATRASNATAASLLLRMRYAMGVGVKADVTAVLLGKDRPVTVRELVETLNYTTVGTRTAVLDLARGGFIFSVGGRPSAFAAPVKEWRTLLRIRRRPRWVNWQQWFALVVEIVAWTERARRKELGSYAVDVGMRELVSRHAPFFRSAAHELEPIAFQLEMGSYPGAIESLVSWAKYQARDGA